MVHKVGPLSSSEVGVPAVQVDKVIVLWTANTERYSEVAEGLIDTTEAFLSSIDNDESEIAPSQHLCSGLHPGRRPLHQRLPAEHLRARPHRSGHREGWAHRLPITIVVSSHNTLINSFPTDHL